MLQELIARHLAALVFCIFSFLFCICSFVFCIILFERLREEQELIVRHLAARSLGALKIRPRALFHPVNKTNRLQNKILEQITLI